MKQLADESPGMPQMWLEHDTWVAPQLRDELRSLPGKRLGMLQIFRMSARLVGGRWRSSDALTENRRSDGYQKVRKGTWLWGSNAVLFPWNAIEHLRENPPPPKGLSCSPDVRFSKQLGDAGFERWCMNPSMAQTDTSLPSSTGHNVTPRMASDTYVE